MLLAQVKTYSLSSYALFDTCCVELPITRINKRKCNYSLSSYNDLFDACCVELPITQIEIITCF